MNSKEFKNLIVGSIIDVRDSRLSIQYILIQLQPNILYFRTVAGDEDVNELVKFETAVYILGVI